MKYTRVIITLLLIFNAPALAEERFSVGTKGRYFCSVDTNGFASLWKRRKGEVSEVNMTSLRRIARRKKQSLRSRFFKTRSTAQSSKKRLRFRLREWRFISKDITECMEMNDVHTACQIFAGVEVKSGIIFSHIIDGNACNRGNSPIVKLRMYSDTGMAQGSCSGVALDSYTILSAAHCFTNGQGKLDTAYVEIQTGSQTFKSSSIAVHPAYTPHLSRRSESNDIAVLKVSEPLNTKVLPFLTNNDLKPGELVAIAGYGITELEIQQGLQAGFMKLNEASDESLEAKYLPGSGSNTCYGDSGGPLAVKRNDQWYIAGITSNGTNWTCGINGREDYSRFANVSALANAEFLMQLVE